MKFNLQSDLYSATFSRLQVSSHSASERYRLFKIGNEKNETIMKMEQPEIDWVLGILSDDLKKNPNIPHTSTSLDILVQTWENIASKASEAQTS